jgi:hypothetical protein
VQRLLWAISDHARLCLVLGLVAGLALPGLAAMLAPWLPQMVAALLMITALRLGHGAIRGALQDVGVTLLLVAALQLALPLSVLGIAGLLGVAASPWVLAVVLATAAPALAGSTNLALILRQDAGAMMRIMVIGTALFPLTVLPLLIAMPQLGAPAAILQAAGRLLCVIVLATGAGFALRAVFLTRADAGQIKALDGLSVLAFSGIVVALMSALTPALRLDPAEVALWMLLAFAISYGLQLVTYRGLGRHPLRGPLAIAAGNRNIALFLVALPETVMAPVMVFIACWQVPMYLSPVLMRWLYRPEVAHE